MPVDRNLVKLRTNDVYESISELNRLTSKRFNEMSIDEKYSTRYNVIVLVEALASLCLHIALEHYGLRLESYAKCFRRFSERLGVRCCRDLEVLTRLRNLLVHRHWAVKDEIVYNSVNKEF